MVVFRMCRTFFVLLKCTIQGGPEVDVLLIAFLYLWLKIWEGIDKYWIVPIRKLFYFHHCLDTTFSGELRQFASFAEIFKYESQYCVSAGLFLYKLIIRKCVSDTISRLSLVSSNNSCSLPLREVMFLFLKLSSLPE